MSKPIRHFASVNPRGEIVFAYRTGRNSERELRNGFRVVYCVKPLPEDIAKQYWIRPYRIEDFEH